MYKYHHQLSGIFTHKNDAQTVYTNLKRHGLLETQMRINPRLSWLTQTSISFKNDSVFNNMLLFGILGSILGIILVSLAEWMLIRAHIELLNSRLTIATIGLIGSAATLGFIVGTTTGAMVRVRNMSEIGSYRMIDRLFACTDQLINKKSTRLSINTYSAEQTMLVNQEIHTSASIYYDHNLTLDQTASRV